MKMFFNEHGKRNINAADTTNIGKHSNLMIGQMAMDNKMGQSTIQLGKTSVMGQDATTSIGLMNLDAEMMNLAQAVPVFDNTDGQRNIVVALLDNEGAKSISRVGEMAMKNKGGKANIQLKKAVAGGKGTLTEVGLLELAQEKAQKAVFNNAGGQRNIILKDFAAGGDKTVSNIGEMAMVNTKGTANI